MMRGNRRNPLYKDWFAPDGMVASGWRIVRNGGRVKVAGSYWRSADLLPIVGELVHFQVYDYWMEKLEISRGLIGCWDFYCYAIPEID